LKAELTSFDVRAIVYELSNTITNARVENIYQTGHKTLLFKLHSPNQPTRQLLVEAGKRVHLTNYVVEKPPSPSVFCTVLRKHLNGGMLESIEQHEFERIITLKIRVRQEHAKLIVELFGEGNIILVDQDNRIVTAMTFRKMRDRNVLRNEIFKHAPASGENPLLATQPQLEKICSLGKTQIVRALVKHLSIGGVYAEELLLRANVDKNTPCQDITQEQIDAIFQHLQSLLDPFRIGRFDPAILIGDQGEWIDVTPTRLRTYEHLKAEPYDSFNKALDEYYTRMSQAGGISEARKEHEKELARQQRMLQDQQEKLDEAQKTLERNKRFGDLLYSHLGELQLLQQQISDAKSRGENWEQISMKLEKEKKDGRSPALYFHSFDAGNLALNLSIESLVIPIRMNWTIQANGAEYYERMKKAERKLEGSKKALEETQGRLEELQKRWTEKTQQTKTEKTPKKLEKAWYEKFRWFNSSDGFLVLGGRDAATNEILIKKYLQAHDIVFHADIVGAPFAIVKTQGKPPTEQAIQEAAQFAASYSRAWREMLSILDVYWIHPEQVSKTSPTGQYLAKGSFIIHGKKNYIRKVALRIALGVFAEKGHMHMIGGPPEAIRRQTNVYVELIPGEQTSAELAKRIRGFLSEKASSEYTDEVSRITIEEIQRFIPPGKSNILKGEK
jgi:predicted ribosome quality control (RQC) complex YloA/Tae2 family protein